MNGHRAISNPRCLLRCEAGQPCQGPRLVWGPAAELMSQLPVESLRRGYGLGESCSLADTGQAQMPHPTVGNASPADEGGCHCAMRFPGQNIVGEGTRWFYQGESKGVCRTAVERVAVALGRKV